ncbi:MAG TPA: histidine triad nucleotide-binding protein [Acidimicrobiales bacterium]|nr:histidine triad nucleotide-binding protein [Acidimicrobiales bacterium]
MSDCVFCRIVAGDVPSDQVASSEHTVAFRDINPAMPRHVLVVPREHIESAATLEPAHADVLSEMFQTARQVAEAEGLAERGYRLVLNVGEDALNSVAHLHMHVLGGRPMSWPPG